jgi:undecaprenyl-diphosphatase
MVFCSILTNRGWLGLALAAVGLIFTDRKPAAWRLALTVVCVYLAGDVVLKAVFGRPRPFDVLSGLPLLVQAPVSSSFPSTHAALGIGGAMAATRVFPAAAWTLWPVGVLAGLSRNAQES